MPSLVEIGPVAPEKTIFKYFQYNFTFSLLSPLGKRQGPSFEQIRIPFTQGCFVPSLVQIGQAVLEKTFNGNLLFCYYLPLEKGVAFQLNKLEIPLPKNALCQDWLILAQWFWRRQFLNIFNIILHFCSYLPLEKGVAFHLNKHKFPPSKDALCHVW